jgi:hypothetical protein
MATKKSAKPSKQDEIKMLEQKIAKLEQENKNLKDSVPKKTKKEPLQWFRKLGVIFFITLSIVMFMLFNIASWTKNTLLDTNTFVNTMQPVIGEPAVQKVVQDDITTKLFEKVDIEAKLQETLPENVAFLSGPLSSQIESFVYSKVGSVLASQQIYDAWGNSLERIHTRLIGYINNENADGVITVNDIYASISDRVSEDSKISFLFNKTLPEKFGSITLAEVSWLPEARSYVNLLTIAPPIMLAISLVSAVLAIVLSRRKKIVFGAILALTTLLMAATLAALWVITQRIGDQVDAKYADAAQAIFSTISAPLEARTQGYLALLLITLVVLVLTSNASYIKKTRKFLHLNIQKVANSILPKVTVPSWLLQVSDKSSIISWTAFVVLFIVLGVRIPPVYDQVVKGFIISTVVVFVIYIARIVIASLDRKK